MRWKDIHKLSAVISIAYPCKLHWLGSEGARNQTGKCNVCKYCLPQIGPIDGSFPQWERLKFKSSLSHQHTLLLSLHYSSQSLHYSCHFASHFVTCFIYKEPHEVSRIIAIVVIIIARISLFSREGRDPYWLLLPQPLSALVFFRCFCGTPGFTAELWHLNQDCDLGPNGTSGVPRGTTGAQAIFWPRLDVHGLSGRQSHLTLLAC